MQQPEQFWGSSLWNQEKKGSHGVFLPPSHPVLDGSVGAGGTDLQIFDGCAAGNPEAGVSNVVTVTGFSPREPVAGCEGWVRSSRQWVFSDGNSRPWPQATSTA